MGILNLQEHGFSMSLILISYEMILVKSSIELPSDHKMKTYINCDRNQESDMCNSTKVQLRVLSQSDLGRNVKFNCFLISINNLSERKSADNQPILPKNIV